MSSMRAFAPSTMTFLPEERAGGAGVGGGEGGGGRLRYLDA
jgi:hypothetical protein